MNIIDKEQEEERFGNYGEIIKAQAKEFVRITDPETLNRYVSLLNFNDVTADDVEFKTTMEEVDGWARECLVEIVKKHDSGDLGGLITAKATDYGIAVKKLFEGINN